MAQRQFTWTRSRLSGQVASCAGAKFPQNGVLSNLPFLSLRPREFTQKANF
jgi:hypothetical protein